jgi:hypothetical protein
VADARFDQRVGVALVDVEDAVHPLQVEDDAARQYRRRRDLLFLLAPERRVGITVERDVLVAREHPLPRASRQSLLAHSVRTE